MRPAGSAKALERRRLEAISLLQQGWFPVDVARRLKVDRRTVRRWRASYDKKGKAGVAARPTPGRPPKLDLDSKKKLEGYLLQGAQAFGYRTDLWTCSRVAELIRKKFGVRYHDDHMGRFLRSMGWSLQRPTRRARERDEVEIERWAREDWPRIKKKRRGSVRP